MISNWIAKRTRLLFFALTLVSALIYLHSRYLSPLSKSLNHEPHRSSKKPSICDDYPDEGDIAISVKTGATEVLAKLPAVLKTSLQCINDVMVFSDLQQTLGDLQIHDVLSDFTSDAMEKNPEFDIYRKQKKLAAEHRESEIPALVDMLAPTRGPETKDKSASWILDKYKFIHMLERAYSLQPNRAWYVFIEADTYVSWPKLNRWLARLDAGDKMFLGNAVQKTNGRPPRQFAHGGSGFVLSGSAMRDLMLNHTGTAREMDAFAHKWWAGDMMLADVLYQTIGLEVTDAKPSLFHLDATTYPSVQEMASNQVIMAHPVPPSKFAEIYKHELGQNFARLQLTDIVAILADEIVTG